MAQRYGDPQIEQPEFSFNGRYKLSDAATFHAFGGARNLNSTSNGFFRAAGASNNIVSIYPEGYLPLELVHAQDRRGVASLRGTVADGWHYDLSADCGCSRIAIDTAHSLNTGIGPASPTCFFDGILQSEQGALNADLSKDVTFGFLPNAVTVASGGEYRHENHSVRAGDPASYFGTGAQVYPGFTPNDAGSHSRHSHAANFDLETNFTDKFSTGLAGRYEDYSDFGSALSGKLSARYRVADAIAVRATASNGFRAPSLAQEYFSATSTNLVSTTAGNQLQQVRTFPVSDPAAIALGAEPLKAEKSRNDSAGLVLQPADAFSATIDAYQITIDHRIVLSGNLIGTAMSSYLRANGYPGVQGGRYFTHAVNTRTRGVDLVANYRLDFDSAGTLNLSLAANHNETDILYVQPNPAILRQNGLVRARVTRDEVGRITLGSPKDKYVFGADWSFCNLTLHGDVTRYGEVTVLNVSNAARDQTCGAKWLLDVSGTYRLDRWDFTLGADNLTSTYPDETIHANSQSGQLPYSNCSPFGFNGAFVHAGATLHW